MSIETQSIKQGEAPTGSASAGDDLFRGLRVLEVGAGSIAGSLAGMMFADFGASVLKVEPPGGDRLRAQLPSGFLVWNRGKGSKVVDLRTTPGQDEYKRLSGTADIVIEAFSPGQADRWSVGEAVLRAENPSLIYTQIRGFGPGAYEAIPGYEALVAAKAGLFSTGRGGGELRPGPFFPAAPIANFGAGHQAFAGTVSALLARESSGRGQRVEATLLQGLVPNDYFGTMTWQHMKRLGLLDAGTSTTAATSKSKNAFDLVTSDGRWIITTQMMARQAQALSRAVGAGDTIDDPRFVSQPNFASVEDAEAWGARIFQAVRRRPWQEWEPILTAEPDIAFELVRTAEEGLSHPQVIHNGNVISVVDEHVGVIRQVGPVARMSQTPARISRSAPSLDSHHESEWSGGGRATRPELGGAPRGPRGCPLEGLTIVEVGYFYAMPYAVTMAASLGARVIKVESLAGDPMRSSYGFRETGGAKTMEGKESLCVDLATAAGREVLARAVAAADIVVDGFRPGVLARWGFGHEALLAADPHLTYIHAGGYGADGPYAHRPIYASVASTIVGSSYLQAGDWLSPELSQSMSADEIRTRVLPRLHTGPTDGDSNASLAVLSTILLAAYHQRRTGRGQFVSTSMIGGNALAYADDFCSYENKPEGATLDDDQLGLGALYRCYRAADGWVAVAVFGDAEFGALSRGIGRPDLTADPRFAHEQPRRLYDDDLAGELSQTFEQQSASFWEETLLGLGVGCVAVYGGSASEFTCTDEELRRSGFTTEVDHPYFGPVIRPAPVLRFSESATRAAPGVLLGQHTKPLLAEFGYDATEVRSLLDAGVVRSPAAVISPYGDYRSVDRAYDM